MPPAPRYNRHPAESTRLRIHLSIDRLETTSHGHRQFVKYYPPLHAFDCLLSAWEYSWDFSFGILSFGFWICFLETDFAIVNGLKPKFKRR